MRTIISGFVNEDDIANADLLAGIVPTSYVTNGRSDPPLSILPVATYPVDVKLGHFGEDARDYTLCQNADALIVAGSNDHLVRIAQQYGLPVFET